MNSTMIIGIQTQIKICNKKFYKTFFSLLVFISCLIDPTNKTIEYYWCVFQKSARNVKNEQKDSLVNCTWNTTFSQQNTLCYVIFLPFGPFLKLFRVWEKWESPKFPLKLGIV